MNIPVKVKCDKCGYQWYYTGEKKGTTCSNCRGWIKIKKPAFAESRKKRKMTIEEIFDSAIYRSIILLTDCFDKGTGLRQMHYRWALISNHDNIIEPSLISEEMKTFFEETMTFKNIDVIGEWKQFYNDQYKYKTSNSKLDRLFNEGIIKRDCVTSDSNLSNKLKRLTDEYHILEKVLIDREVVSYIMTRDGYLKAQRWMANQLVKGIADERLEELNKLIMNFISLDEYHFDLNKEPKELIITLKDTKGLKIKKLKK